MSTAPALCRLIAWFEAGRTEAKLGAGEYVYKIGDISSSLNICLKGKVALTTREGLLGHVLATGEHFGQSALISNQNRTHAAVALANCDIVMLCSQDAMQCMQRDPYSTAVIRENAARL
jgi:CRP-like cAMP-binding protein